MGRGFAVGESRVPIVPAAILFDLGDGAERDWPENPYKALGRAALEGPRRISPSAARARGSGPPRPRSRAGSARPRRVLADGTVVGAGRGQCARLRDGGRGAAFLGRAVRDRRRVRRARPGVAFPDPLTPPTKLAPHGNTTIGIVATDATLTQAQCTRLATAAHDGLRPRAAAVAHADGRRSVFAAATGARPAPDMAAQVLLGHAAACTMARAIGARSMRPGRCTMARGPSPAACTPRSRCREIAPPTWSARFVNGAPAKRNPDARHPAAISGRRCCR